MKYVTLFSRQILTGVNTHTHTHIHTDTDTCIPQRYHTETHTHTHTHMYTIEILYRDTHINKLLASISFTS